jgi:hypothetical protein
MNVVFPDWFDDYEWETVAKGYFVGVMLHWAANSPPTEQPMPPLMELQTRR